MPEIRVREQSVFGLARALFVVSSIGAELGAVDALLRGCVLLALACHFASSVLIGAVACVATSAGAERWRHAGFAAVVAASLPGIGALGVVAVLSSSSRASGSRALAMMQLSRPDWSEASVVAAEHVDRILAISRSTGERVQVLLSQRGMPAAAAVPGLRAALRDPREEVRLLAHALLDRRETQLRVALAALEGELSVAGAALGRRWQLLRRLAYASWAIVEAELVQGELAREALARVGRLGAEAHALRADGELCLLLVRVSLRQSDGLAAWHWLEQAERAGVECELRAPLCAEAAFLLRRFEQIPFWLRRAGRPLWRPKLRRLAAVWMQAARNSSSGAPRHSRERT